MVPSTNRPALGRILVAFALVYVIWGSTYFAIRITLDSMTPSASAALRFMVAGPLLLALLRLSGQPVGIPGRELAQLAVIGILLLVGGNALVVWSEQYVASGLAALMVATTPLWIAILGAALPRGERLSPIGWAGVLLGLLGLGVLLWPKLSAGTGTEARGAAALVAATFSWAVGSLYAKRRTLTARPLVATAWEMTFAGLALFPVAVASGGFAHFAPGPAAWLALLYLVVCGSCVAFSAFVWLLHHVPAAKVMTYAYVNPVIAVLLGCAFRDEPLTTAMLVGTPIIIAAVALVTSAKVHSVATAPTVEAGRAPARDAA